MAELRECPFCGGKAYIDKYMQPKEEYRVRCLYCHTSFGRCAGLSKKEAIKAWNRRYIPPSEIDFDYGAED